MEDWKRIPSSPFSASSFVMQLNTQTPEEQTYSNRLKQDEKNPATSFPDGGRRLSCGVSVDKNFRYLSQS
jgi:hypothetical protein